MALVGDDLLACLLGWAISYRIWPRCGCRVRRPAARDAASTDSQVVN